LSDGKGFYLNPSTDQGGHEETPHLLRREHHLPDHPLVPARRPVGLAREQCRPRRTDRPALAAEIGLGQGVGRVWRQSPGQPVASNDPDRGVRCVVSNCPEGNSVAIWTLKLPAMCPDSIVV
jgi:hypothetical protein